MVSSLTFLGTSGSSITKLRACAGILLDDKLLDVGFGVAKNLLNLPNEIHELREIYVTHTHSDHIGDFTGLVWAMAIRERVRPLHVIGSASSCATLKRILELQSTPKKGFLKFEIQFSTPQKMRVPFVKTIHDPENLGYRLKAGNTEIVYTGDTSKSEEVSKFSEHADILIHDATFPSEKKTIAKLTNHSTVSDAANVAKKARVSELILTHASPINKEGFESDYLKEARGVFDGKTRVAFDFLKIEV